MSEPDPFEEDSDWVPLYPSDLTLTQSKDHDVDTHASSTSNTVRHLEIDIKKGITIRSDDHSFKSRSRESTYVTSHRERLLDIQQKHEMKQSVRQNLVYRPLANFPKLFMRYFVLEVWNSNQSIRIGIFLMIIGLCTQALSLAFVLHQTLRMLPRILLTTGCVIILSYLYMVPKVRRIKIPTENIMDGFWTFLESIDGRLLRKMMIGMVFIVPTLIEMVALMLLSGMIAEGEVGWIKIGLCWLSICVEGVIYIRVHFDIKVSSASVRSNRNEEQKQKAFPMGYWGNGKYVIGKITLMRKTQTTLFQCKVHAWIYLYVMALLTTTIQVTINRIHQPLLLSGPFLVATGAFFILSAADDRDDEFFLSILRRVLRKSLHDVLLDVGDCVAEDEMLRLAMLRWIVDYWTSARQSSMQCPNDNICSKMTNNQDDESTVNSIHEIGIGRDAEVCPTDTLSVAQNISSVSNHNSTCNDCNGEDEDQLEWSRLYSMLNITTDQMFHEVNNSAQDEENVSVKALKQMLSCLDYHERAKPAIESYKRAIHELSPTRPVAIYVGIANRCPAMISCFFLYLLQPIRANQCTIMLLPLILFELMRLSEWVYVCSQICQSLRIDDERLRGDIVQSEHNWVMTLFPIEVSSMEILLCKDDYESHKNGKAMNVWLNVCQSARALESGLMAIKCVQTAQVASDLAFNIVSLTKIVHDVKNEGVGGGAGLIFLDLFHFHMGRSDSVQRHDNGGTGEHRENFVKAAIDLVENSQRLTRHVNELAEDNNARTALFSFVSFAMNNLRGNSKSDKVAELDNTVEKMQDVTIKCIDDMQIDIDDDTDSNHDMNPKGDDNENDVSWTTIRKPMEHTSNDNIPDRAKETNERHVGVDLKFIGAVGAIIGTIVGGIALTSNKGDVTESCDDSSKKNKRSSVVIEQIDEDES